MSGERMDATVEFDVIANDFIPSYENPTEEIPVDEIRAMVLESKSEFITALIIQCAQARGDETELERVAGGLTTGD